MILAFVYIPPPYKNEVIRDLLLFMEKKQDCPTLIQGDFNCVMDPSVDRININPGRNLEKDTPLKKLCSEIGFHDIWRMKYPGKKMYSCFSGSHKAMSRIDVGLGNNMVMEYVKKILYELNTISDHYLLVTDLLIGRSSDGAMPRRINPHWLSIIKQDENIIHEIQSF